MQGTINEGKPKGYLTIWNVSKKHNVGNMIRSAVALGMDGVVIIGNRKLQFFGAKGSDSHIPIHVFPTMELAKQWFKENNITVCGVEIDSTAKDVREHPFQGNTAIMMGNEGDGMDAKQKSFCDYFVYIPQFGTGTASLNVCVASSIVMHEYAHWAQYQEAPRQTECDKYVVKAEHRKQIIFHKDPNEEEGEETYESGCLFDSKEDDDENNLSNEEEN
ncbi:hypothetical protein WA158_001118 [Blastocystis sp. Blastoise]